MPESAPRAFAPPASVAPVWVPQVSVIVPAYGVACFLGEAVGSLQAQDVPDWEAVVIDDGSPDDVVGALAPFASDPRVRLLQTPNHGVSAARNRAVAASQAPLIAFLDGDDAYEPAYLRRMTAAIEADPGLGFVGCDAVIVAGRGPRRRYSERYDLAGPVSLGRVLSRRTRVFTAAIVRRAAFTQVGGFDAGLAAAEDLDLWIRVLAAGWRADVRLEPLVRYRRRPGSLSSSERRLLTCSVKVYAKAAEQLAGREEEAIARRELASCAQALRWLEGEALVVAGDAANGLALLAGSERRSRRWRLVMAALRSVPELVVVLLRARRDGVFRTLFGPRSIGSSQTSSAVQKMWFL